MRHLTLPRAASTILALLFLLSPAVARAQLAPSYSQDDQLRQRAGSLDGARQVGPARQLGAMGRAGQARDAQLPHPRPDREGGGPGQAGQGVRARRGDAQRSPARDHPEPGRGADHQRERRLRSGDPARAVRPQAQPGRGQLHDHAQPRGHAPRYVRAHLPRELAVQQHAAAQAGGHRARRRGEREVHRGARRPPRRGQVQGQRPAAGQLLDHHRGSSKHREGAGRRDPEGRRPAHPHGLAEDVGRAGSGRTGGSVARQVPAAGAGRRARHPPLPERHGDRGDRRGHRGGRVELPAPAGLFAEGVRRASRGCRCTSTSSGTAAPTSSRS